MRLQKTTVANYNATVRRAATLLTILILAACARETPAPPPPAPATVAPEPVADGGRLARRLEARVQTLNYVLQTTEDERQVLALLYDPLIALDINLQPVPATVARWEILDEGKTFLLHLDPKATFSDGKPVRASDVIFTIGRILDEESVVFGASFADLDREATKAIDDKTVRVVFKEARPGRIHAFAIAPMPEHVYGVGDFAKNTQAIGNGPYVLRRRNRDGSLLLERRDDYWRDKPKISSVLFRPISDGAVAWRAMQRGDVDVMRVDNDLWARVREDAAVNAQVVFHDVWQLAYNAVVWNLEQPALTDVRIRRALAMSFDRETMIRTLHHGQARPVSGPFTPDQWAANPSVEPIAFNPEAAAALFASAGWTDGDGDGIREREGKPFELELLIVAGSRTSLAQAQVYQETLRGVGVTLDIVPLDESAFYDRVMKRNFEAAFLSWVNDIDPDPYALFHSSQSPPEGWNVAGYDNEEADQLMDEARRELDPARRSDLLHNLHEILARDQPYLWTVQVAEKWAVNRRVQNVHVAKALGLFLWQPDSRAWWLKSEPSAP